MKSPDVDALARLLDGDPTLNGEATAETRELGQLAHLLATHPVYPPVPPDPEFRTELRAALVEAARDEAAAPSALTKLRGGVRAATVRWRYSARLAAATGATALALSSGGMAVAAHRALPSDALYPAKLAIEDARIAFVRDHVSRGEAHLAQASARVTEAEVVASSGDQAGAARALTRGEGSARSGAGELIRAYQDNLDAGYVELLAVFTDEQAARLATLDDLLAGDALDAARAFATALERIEARMLAVTGQCPACPGGVPGAGTGFDFGHIPPADEPFEACPCELGTSGTPSTPVPPAAEDEDPPAVDAPPVAPPAEDAPVEPHAPPASLEPPINDEAPATEPTLPRPDRPTPGERPEVPLLPPLPEHQDEPLRSRGDGNLIERVLRSVLDVVR